MRKRATYSGNIDPATWPGWVECKKEPGSYHHAKRFLYCSCARTVPKKHRALRSGALRP